MVKGTSYEVSHYAAIALNLRDLSDSMIGFVQNVDNTTDEFVRLPCWCAPL